MKSKKNDKTLKIKYLMVVFVLTVVYLCLDYFNVPKQLGITINNLNMDILGIVINSVVVITLYLVSFFAIEKRAIVKEKNKRDSAVSILNEIYNSCLDNVNILSNSTTREALNLQLTNAPLYKQEVIQKYEGGPFAVEGIVIAFSNEGIITSKELLKYYEIKQLHSFFVSYAIIISNDSELNLFTDNIKKRLVAAINKAKTDLAENK